MPWCPITLSGGRGHKRTQTLWEWFAQPPEPDELDDRATTLIDTSPSWRYTERVQAEFGELTDLIPQSAADDLVQSLEARIESLRSEIAFIRERQA